MRQVEAFCWPLIVVATKLSCSFTFPGNCYCCSEGQALSRLYPALIRKKQFERAAAMEEAAFLRAAPQTSINKRERSQREGRQLFSVAKSYLKDGGTQVFALSMQAKDTMYPRALSLRPLSPPF